MSLASSLANDYRSTMNKANKSTIRNVIALAAAVSASLAAFCCGGGPSRSGPPLVMTLSPTTLLVLPDGEPATVDVTVTGGESSKPVTLSVTGVPGNTTASVQSPEYGTSGSVTFTVAIGACSAIWPPVGYCPPGLTPPGTYNVTVNASNGASTTSASLTLNVAIMAQIFPPNMIPPDTLNTFMTTSFQPASWTDQFFVQNPTATTTLNNLQPQHIRMQVIDRDIPQTTATTWDFSYLDGIMNPVLSVADHSPEFQIARGPDFMYDSTGKNFLDPTYQQFAGFAVNLVQYYNKGGFTDGSGVFHQSSSSYPITWWGIYNEPNINGLTATQYVNLYNTVVPAMQAVDSSLKFAAVELADFGTEPQNYLPTFVSSVTAQVDVLATHFYSTCNQADTDQTIFDSITNYLPHIYYIYSQLQTNPALANVPVWMTENNINADYSDAHGNSVCNPGQKFVTDQRGTSAFFAAWRPTLFSKMARWAHVRAIYHWDFNADAQYGEVNGTNGQTYLSYWVDYWLSRLYASPPGAQILYEVDTADTVEILATQQSDGSVLIMVANHTVKNPTDNNGTGDARTVVLNLSELRSFAAAATLTLDATTNTTTGPSPVSVTAAPFIPLTLNGYGVTFLTLK